MSNYPIVSINTEGKIRAVRICTQLCSYNIMGCVYEILFPPACI